MITNLQARLTATRDGVSFAQCLVQCAQALELVVSYDCLHGTNLAGSASAPMKPHARFHTQGHSISRKENEKAYPPRICQPGITG